jgi:hypothetical protein
MIVATVTIQSAESHIDSASIQNKCRTLLLRLRLGTGRIYDTAHFNLPSFAINSYQNMGRSLYLRYCENQARLRIVDRRASNAKGINVAAG